jgi:hypothetical protein
VAISGPPSAVVPKAPLEQFVEKSYPADSIFHRWPRDADGRTLNYWELED